MTNKEEFDFFVEQLIDNAVKEFKETAHYALLKEKLDRMNCDCSTMLTGDDKDFALECFELISDVNGQEEQYVYRKGLCDCVKILRWIGVLA